MSRKLAPVVPPSPTRYLSVSSDPVDTRCESCDGAATIRRGPGDYADCADCKNGRVAPRGLLPRLWRVIGFGALPECRDGDLDAALIVWISVPEVREMPWKSIPVWDGDAGALTTLDAILPAPQAPGTRVRLYSVGYGRSFPGAITEQTAGGAFATTEGRPDGDGARFYPARYIVTDDRA